MFSQQQKSGGRRMGEGKLDEEQEGKFQETVDLLLAGGYFRARIEGLTRFDKVVGGMAWCILNSYFDLDIDLFFQEEASIGQRIRIAEQVVAALLRMKCPHRLEPSQIQGGMNTADYTHIFPVVQWLVSKVIETRRETGDIVMQFTHSQFDKNFELPSETEFKQRKPRVEAFVTSATGRYSAERKLKRPGRRAPYLNKRTEEENVSAALLEYGELTGSGRALGDDEGEADGLKAKLEGPKAREERLRREREEEARREALRATMQAAAARGMAIDANLIESMLGDLSSIEKAFGATADDLAAMDPEAAAKLFAKRQHEQHTSRLQKEIDALEAQNQEAEALLVQLQQQLAEAQAAAAEQDKYNARLEAEIAKLDAMVTDDNREVLQMLQALVALVESLKQQAASFKDNCRRQMQSYTEKIADLKEKAESGQAAQERREAQAAYDADEDKLMKLRSLAGKKARQIALVQRKIDEIPSRAELAQYQKQFVELYEQVAAKLIETRQYFETYNSLMKQREFLDKEKSILQSVVDNYPEAAKAKAKRQQFQKSVAEILVSVDKNLAQQQSRYQEHKSTKAKVTAQLSGLVNTERQYYAEGRSLREESARNAALQQSLQDQE